MIVGRRKQQLTIDPNIFYHCVKQTKNSKGNPFIAYILRFLCDVLTIPELKKGLSKLNLVAFTGVVGEGGGFDPAPYH